MILLVTQMILRITRGDALGAQRAYEAVIAVIIPCTRAQRLGLIWGPSTSSSASSRQR